jgi:hypothetical protein
MSYRFNTIDIVVGVGICAIVFGAFLFFVAANGILQAALPQPMLAEEPVGLQLGMTWLQPTLGQAIVDQAIFERRSNQAVAQSASEWNRATLAYHEWQSLPDGPFGAIRHQAVVVPAEHMARVQGVMGRAIVNFTQRGIRSGVLSADQYVSDFNTNMIRATEARGQRLDHEFATTWQATLGRRIVDAAQHYTRQAGAIQERLGAALVQVVQAQQLSEEGNAARQGQMASLVMAAARTEALEDRLTLLAAIESFPEETTVAATTTPAAWPEMPMGYLLVAGLVLFGIFLGGLRLAAQSRELKALGERKYNASRWVYRTAA